MTKRAEIILGLGLILFALFVLWLGLTNADTYHVPNFLGGLNLLTDSTGLAPNQYLVGKNLTLDMPNVLSARQGYSFWDSVAVDTTQEIQAITVYEPSAGTARMVFACSGFVYIYPTLAKPTGVNWDTLKMDYSNDSLDITPNTTYSTSIALNQDFWYSFVQDGDFIRPGAPFASYGGPVTVGWTSDQKLICANDLSGTRDTVTYRIVRHIVGQPSFSQHGSNLFIADSSGYPVYYDDTRYYLLSLIDSGFVTDTIPMDTNSAVLSGFDIPIGIPDFSIFSLTIAECRALLTAGIGAGDRVRIYWGDANHSCADRIFSALITKIDTIVGGGTYGVVTMDRQFTFNACEEWHAPVDFSFANYTCRDTGYAIEDGGKNWNDVFLKYADFFLTSFLSVQGDSGFKQFQTIYCNEESTFTVDRRIEIGEPYYIFSMIPYAETSVTLLPYFKQMFFYNEQLYGIGHAIDVWYQPWRFRNFNYNWVWYSDVNYPQYMKWDYNFQLPQTDAPNVLFSLYDQCFIASKSSIYKTGGIQNTEGIRDNSYLSKVVSNNGIPDLDNWTKATEEYGYFGNQTGIYKFNGVRAEKISALIDPVLKTYNQGRMVLGYFPAEQKLFVSFPDSDITFYYDERFDCWPSWFDFGMTCFYAPADTNIFYFGHSNYKGRIFYWPNGSYTDCRPGNCSAPSVEYQTGWLDFGDYTVNKGLGDAYFPMLNIGGATIYVYTDFATAHCDSFVTDTTGRYVYRAIFDNDCTGEYFKLKILTTAGVNTIIKGYRVTWQGLPDIQK